jgi:hypothetical protein
MGFDRQAWRKKALKQEQQIQTQGPLPNPFINPMTDEQFQLILPYLSYALTQRFGIIDKDKYLSPGQVPEIISMVIEQIGCPPLSEEKIPEIISLLANLSINLLFVMQGKKNKFKLLYRHELMKNKFKAAKPEIDRLYNAIKAVGFSSEPAPEQLREAAIKEFDDNAESYHYVKRDMLESISYNFTERQAKRDFSARLNQCFLAGAVGINEIRKIIKQLD